MKNKVHSFFNTVLGKVSLLLVIAGLIVVAMLASYYYRKSTNESVIYLKDLQSAELTLKSEPNNYGALMKKGIAEYNLGRFDDAIKTYGLATSVDAGNYLAWNNLGNTYRQMKQYAKAETAYNKAIELDSKKINPYINLAGTYRSWSVMDGTKHKLILQTLQQGLVANPDNEILLQELVDYYDRAGDADNAQKYRDQLSKVK
jgi:tetratricopeptide (TPR) repeat protein